MGKGVEKKPPSKHYLQILFFMIIKAMNLFSYEFQIMMDEKEFG